MGRYVAFFCIGLSRKEQSSKISLHCLFFLQAMDMDEEQLQETCLELIDRTASLTFESGAFLKIRKETLEKIVQRSTLEIDEKDVYEACLLWAEDICSDRGIQVTLKDTKRYILFLVTEKAHMSWHGFSVSDCGGYPLV